MADDPSTSTARSVPTVQSAGASVEQWLRRWWPALLCAALIGAMSAVVFHLHATRPEWGSFQRDVVAHLNYAMSLLEGTATIPHPGFHLASAVVAGATGATLATGAVVVLSVSKVAAYAVTVHALHKHSPATPLVAAVVGLGITVAAALYVPWFSTNSYLGHGTPNVWHNPTWTTMQPWALASFFAFVSWRQKRGTSALVAFSAFLAVSVVFKPSWALVVLPVVGLLALPHLRRRSWWHLPLAVVPTVAILAAQLLLAGGGQGGGFAVDPWRMWSHYTPSIPTSVMLVMAFPLAGIVAGRHAWSWKGLTPAIGAWIVALLQRSLLVEANRPLHGNWGWGYHTALTVLFIVAAVLVLRSGTGRAAWAVLVLHVLSGGFYLWRLMTGVGFA